MIVAGAGPAGSIAALGLARRGARVLLVERARLPRDKVCGCCLGGAGVDLLRGEGLGAELDALRPSPLRLLDLRVGRARATVPLRPGMVVSRSILDAMLARAAVRAGATLVDGVSARLSGVQDSGGRGVRLTRADAAVDVACRVAIAADGLGGTFLGGLPEFRPHVLAAGRIGLGTRFHARAPAARGAVTMVIGAGAYVGAAELEDGTLDVAASVDADRLRARADPGALLAGVLSGAGVDLPLEGAKWRGTPRLTRRRETAIPGVFVIGNTRRGLEWRRRESNPRPRSHRGERLQA